MIHWKSQLLAIIRHHHHQFHHLPTIQTTTILCLALTTTTLLRTTTSVSFTTTTKAIRRSIIRSSSTTNTLPTIQMSMSTSTTSTTNNNNMSSLDMMTTTTMNSNNNNNSHHHPPKVNLLDLAAACIACAEAASRVITSIAKEPSSSSHNDNNNEHHGDEVKDDLTTATNSDAVTHNHHQSHSSSSSSSTTKNNNNSNAMKKNTRYKEDGSFVTDADYAAQGIIVDAIHMISPQIRIVGEESAEEMALHSKKYYSQNQNNNDNSNNDENVVFQRAQQEIRYRYHRQVVHPMPLAQQQGIPIPPSPQTSSTESSSSCKDYSNTNHDPDMATTTTTMTDPTVAIPKDPDDCYVDVSRVGVVVDPLDGTKSYAQGDYDAVSVLICILLDNQPYFGVISKPFGYHTDEKTAHLTTVLNQSCVIVYGGPLIQGVYIAGGKEIVASPLTTMMNDKNELPRAVISSSRSMGEVQDFCAHLAALELIHKDPLLISGAGEKSLRLILQVNHEALWFFPKKGTSLWDVAAPDAILRSLGGKLTDKFGQDMDYSKPREDAENMEGVVACIDATLHAKCIELYRQGDWANRGYK